MAVLLENTLHLTQHFSKNVILSEYFGEEILAFFAGLSCFLPFIPFYQDFFFICK